MSLPIVGQPAPGFKLPSAQGPEVALEDYRGRRNVIIWFTKGMACVFCRQQMTQLARAYEQFKQKNTEVLEISPSTMEKGRLYAAKYKLPFPYLCDPDDTARQSWHIGARLRSPAWYLNAMVTSMKAPNVGDFEKVPPGLSDVPKLLRDDDAGVFIVDREGILRYAHAGPYMQTAAQKLIARPIPGNDEILRELDRCN